MLVADAAIASSGPAAPIWLDVLEEVGREGSRSEASPACDGEKGRWLSASCGVAGAGEIGHSVDAAPA